MASRRTLTAQAVSAGRYFIGAFVHFYINSPLSHKKNFNQHTWVVEELREPNTIVQERKREAEEPLHGQPEQFDLGGM